MADSKHGNGKGGRTHELRIARTELKHSLARTENARQRLDLLISHEKCEAIIPTLPAEDLYFTLKEVGLADATELVRLASPTQFRAFVDLDAWKHDKPLPLTALTWLRAASTDEDEERFRKKIHALDMEMLELILRRVCRVHDLEEEPDPDTQGIPYRSPEGRYLVEFLVDGAEYAGARRLLDELYAEDTLRTVRLLEAVRWELVSELEETALRWRTGRLQDLGFPELSDALSYFAYVDPDAALPTLDKPPAVPDTFLLARAAPKGSFFDRAAAEVADENREILERQVVTVLNAALVVESVDAGDLDAVQRTILSARDTLSLGLEYAAKGDLNAGAALLVASALKRVFQVGVSVGLRLKFRADRLMKSGKASLPGTGEQALLDPPLDAAIVGLRRKRPQYAESLDDPTAPPERLRALRDRADALRLGAALEDAERIAEVMEKLGFNAREAAGASERRFSDFFLTALVHALLGEPLAFTPVRAEQLKAFADKAFVLKDGTAAVSEDARALALSKAREAASSLSQEHERAAEKLVAAALARLLDEAGDPWMLGTLEPRVVPVLFAL